MSSQNVSGKYITEFVITGFDMLQHPFVIGVVILILYLAVMLANLTNMYFIITDKHFHQPMYILICNLAIVDMFYGTSTCPTMIGTLVVGVKTITHSPCIVQMFFYHVTNVMEVFTISAMALDRLIAIASPLHYHMIITNFRSVLAIAVLWMMSLAIVYINSYDFLPLPLCNAALKYVFCDFATVIRTRCGDPVPFFTAIYIASLVVNVGSFIFVCLSYIYIFIIVAKISSNKDKKKAVNTCISHLIVIGCFYGPIFTSSILTRVGLVLSIEDRNGFVVGPILGPCLVNPFIYCLRTKKIRKRILRLIPKVWSISNEM